MQANLTNPGAQENTASQPTLPRNEKQEKMREKTEIARALRFLGVVEAIGDEKFNTIYETIEANANKQYLVKPLLAALSQAKGYDEATRIERFKAAFIAELGKEKSLNGFNLMVSDIADRFKGSTLEQILEVFESLSSASRIATSTVASSPVTPPAILATSLETTDTRETKIAKALALLGLAESSSAPEVAEMIVKLRSLDSKHSEKYLNALIKAYEDRVVVGNAPANDAEKQTEFRKEFLRQLKVTFAREIDNKAVPKEYLEPFNSIAESCKGKAKLNIREIDAFLTNATIPASRPELSDAGLRGPAANTLVSPAPVRVVSQSFPDQTSSRARSASTSSAGSSDSTLTDEGNVLDEDLGIETAELGQTQSAAASSELVSDSNATLEASTADTLLPLIKKIYDGKIKDLAGLLKLSPPKALDDDTIVIYANDKSAAKSDLTQPITFQKNSKGDGYSAKVNIGHSDALKGFLALSAKNGVVIIAEYKAKDEETSDLEKIATALKELRTSDKFKDLQIKFKDEKLNQKFASMDGHSDLVAPGKVVVSAKPATPFQQAQQSEKQPTANSQSVAPAQQ